MDSEPDGGSSLNIQPETSKDLEPSEEVKPLKPGDKEIGGGDLTEIDDSPIIGIKEIGQGDFVSPLAVTVSSPNNDNQDAKSSDDLEVILDSADDDESLHLKWDDDEEIEDDIISLDIPASPPKDNPDELVTLTEKDKENLVGDVSDDDNINKVTITEPIGIDPPLQTKQLDIDNICAEIKNNIDEIDDFENECDNKDIAPIPLCPTVTDDLILIEDDDNIDVIPAPEAEKVTNNEVIILKDMSYEETEGNNDKLILNVENSKNVDDSQKTNTAIDVQDKMEIDLVEDESEQPKDIITNVINSKIESIADSKTTETKIEVDISSNILINDKITVDKKGLVTSSPNESLSDASAIDPNQDHGLDKPDMMLEIPTQEVIDFLDDTDVSIDLNKSNETAEKIDIKDEVTANDTSSATNEKNIVSTENSKLSPDAKDVEDKIEITDTAKITKVQEETKEKGKAMDVTKDNKETNRDTTPEHAASNNEILKSVVADEEKSITELLETDKPEFIASNDTTVKSVTAEEHNTQLQDTDIALNTASKTDIPEKPIDESESLTFVGPPPLETDTPKTPIVEQSTSFNFVVPALTETTDTESKNVTYEEKPSTSKEIQQPSSKDIDSERNSQAIELGTKSCNEVERSQGMEGTKNELQEVTDSLGLLAESTRSMDDDEEPEDEEDDDDDFDQDQDQDESSNQMTAEHSEDSNAQQSETDGPKDQDDKGTDSPQDEKEDFIFAISDIVTDAAEKDGEDKVDVQDKEGDMEDKDGDVVLDEIIEDEVEVTPEIIGDISAIEEVIAADDIVTEDIDQDIPSEVKEATDVETVKLSDTSDSKVDGNSLLRSMLAIPPSKEPSPTEKTTSVKKLAITQTISTSFNFVDLEESSSEDDVQVVSKKESTPPVVESSSIDLKDVSAVAADIPKTPNKTRTPRINTSEISIRTISSAEAAALPQIQPPEERQAPKLGLEVFSLDSDEEDATKPEDILEEPQKPRIKHKCINLYCKSAGSCGFLKADAATIAYYDAAKKRRTMVCEDCADAVLRRTQSLVDGIKEFTPLLHLDILKLSTELVEISDSESEDEADVSEEVKEKELIGEKGVKLLEEHLADMINMTWKKFKMDDRLTEAQDMLNGELKMLEEQSKEIDTMLNECQLATDKLRKELYSTFEHDRQELTPLIIMDTPTYKTSYLETENQTETTPSGKRRMSSGSDTPAKRAHTEPIPLGYAPIDNKEPAKDNTNAQDKSTPSDTSKLDDDKDISVLQVSAEVAPASLPPPGSLTRPPLRVGAYVYSMRNVFGSWLRGRILEIQGKTTVPGSTHMFTICKVKFEGKARNPVKLLPARCLAYSEPTDVRMTIGTRVIALFKDTNDNKSNLKRDSFYSGVISEVPNPVNKYRYLVFFDDGYAQYVRHADTRLVCECAPLVWEEVHPFSREFVREYLMAYPERPMVRLHAGQSLKTEWNGKWWSSRVIAVDASLVQVHFEEDNRTEWIYRGSTRLAPLYLELQAAERHRARPMPRTKAQPRINMPYVEYTRSDCTDKTEEQTQSSPPTVEQQRETRQRAVAKKSTTPAPAPAPTPAPAPAPQPPAPAENVTSRVVYYTPKNAVKPHKMSPHTCGPHCRRSDVLALKDLRTYNPLAKPLLSGWERQIVRFKGHKEVMYRAPCGRRLRNMRELHKYLRTVLSDMAVDLFDFAPGTHCLAEFVLNSCLVGKKDLSHGKENVPVPCVNYYDESLPEFCSYNTERTPTAGVPLNLDPDFLCGCDCTDDCEDKSKCGCWRMTLEGARTIGLERNVGYVYRRLPEPLPTGIYECNSRCKCKQTCLNRVAQHPLQLKLQVFKTLNRGWGIRALNDVPKGSFLCVYAGNLLTDATANMDGLNEGDEYLAELDYIEVVEQMKEGFEEDIPDADKRLDKKNQAKPSDDSSEEMSSSEEEDTTQDDREDDDFRPDPGLPMRIMEFSKRLRKRDKKKQKEEAREKEKEATPKTEDDCITISDDEEVREPSHFMAQAGMASNPFKSKYRSVRSYFGKDEACYIMDAKVQGNIGRYLNHSCTPNVFVQNVFVDTHDPRFPWVAFFALCHIKAGTELTWNYNYDVGSVPGKVLYCYCGAHNCRGRLL